MVLGALGAILVVVALVDALRGVTVPLGAVFGLARARCTHSGG